MVLLFVVLLLNHWTLLDLNIEAKIPIRIRFQNLTFCRQYFDGGFSLHKFNLCCYRLNKCLLFYINLSPIIPAFNSLATMWYEWQAMNILIIFE
jgi:hypothetical protein